MSTPAKRASRPAASDRASKRIRQQGALDAATADATTIVECTTTLASDHRSSTPTDWAGSDSGQDASSGPSIAAASNNPVTVAVDDPVPNGVGGHVQFAEVIDPVGGVIPGGVEGVAQAADPGPDGVGGHVQVADVIDPVGGVIPGGVQGVAEVADLGEATPTAEVPIAVTVAPPIHHSAFNGLTYVPVEDLERAIGFARKNDPATNRFAIGQLPPDATWGTSPTTERFLVNGKGDVLSVWLLSVIHTKWFYNMNGDPQPRVNVGVKLPFIGDYDAIRRLYGKARPKREDAPDVIYASRMMSRQAKGDDGPTIMPFSAIYDARERFRPKRQMVAISANAIDKGDLVLVEANVTRWKTSKDKKNRKGWSLWDIGFELQAVSHLYDAPAGFADDNVAENLDAEDDM